MPKAIEESASEQRAGMAIDWDVGIVMDDGLILRRDVFRPQAPRRHPVLPGYGPYAKGLAFQDGHPSAWQKMISSHPDVTHGSSNLFQTVQYGFGERGPHPLRQPEAPVKV
jgi:hypothetical protein